MLYNPTDTEIYRRVVLPLYYSGLSETAQVSVDESEFSAYSLNRKYEIAVKVSIPAKGSRKIVIK